MPIDPPPLQPLQRPPTVPTDVLTLSFVWPLVSHWSVLLGIKRIKGDKVTQKLPITPDIMLEMKAKLTRKLVDVAFWAICPVAFFGLFRKGNLLLKTIDDFDPIKHISRDDFLVTDNGLLICVRWSKTI